MQKVRIAGSVNQMQAVPLPFTVMQLGGNGDVALDFFRLKIHG